MIYYSVHIILLLVGGAYMGRGFSLQCLEIVVRGRIFPGSTAGGPAVDIQDYYTLKVLERLSDTV